MSQLACFLFDPRWRVVTDLNCMAEEIYWDWGSDFLMSGRWSTQGACFQLSMSSAITRMRTLFSAMALCLDCCNHVLVEVIDIIIPCSLWDILLCAQQSKVVVTEKFCQVLFFSALSLSQFWTLIRLTAQKRSEPFPEKWRDLSDCSWKERLVLYLPESWKEWMEPLPWQKC